MASTSKDRGIWLIGGTLESITGSKLPSKKQMLHRFFHLHKYEKKSIQSSATITTREISAFWEKAKIPTQKECHVIEKIKKIHCKWQSIKKSASRRTSKQLEAESVFVSDFDNLFDIAHKDALTLISIKEDKEFLLAQREKGRRGSMGPIDTKLSKKEERTKQRQLQNELKIKKETERLKKDEQMLNVNDNNIDCDDSQCSSSDNDELYVPSSKRLKKNNSPTKVNTLFNSTIVTSRVASALDRTKVSDRNAMYVLSATLQSLGHNIQNFTLNRESIRQARREYREKIADEIKTSFVTTIPLTVHWDGKLLPDLTSKDKVDRLAVIVSGDGIMKLLGVPKIPNGTGEAQATAVFELLEEWNLIERIHFMSFDTTASNSGVKAGACVLLEKKIKRDLLSLACRHHILELIIESVFNALMGASSGPNIKIFQRFAEKWNEIDVEKYESGIIEDAVASKLNPQKYVLVKYINDQLATFQPRDDYKELLQLSLIFLGDETAKDFKIRRPGALHRARWMAKLIYSLKIFLFRSQFKLTARELSALEAFNVFVIQVYIKYWYTASSGELAPYNDLNLLKELDNYKKSNIVIGNAAAKSFSRHLWYLSETLIGLAFFDSKVSSEMKVNMVKSLVKKGADFPLRRITVETTAVQTVQLSDFVSKNSLILFKALDIPQDFLNQNPDTWENHKDFIDGCKRVQHLKVVNDAAERGISLIQTFNGIITNQEEQKQYLLQVVEQHRQKYPNPNKSTIDD
uniref:Uncharacterized protein n=1 Tax=Schizaphis graminum TaxID=13262 RepID=A0A2S2PCY9_SCHGA